MEKQCTINYTYSVADLDLVPFLPPGSGIRYEFFPDPLSRIRSLFSVTFFYITFRILVMISLLNWRTLKLTPETISSKKYVQCCYLFT
jgi:hypothetical protein